MSGTSVINDFVPCFCIISTREMSCFLSSNFSDEPLLFFLFSVPSDWFIVVVVAFLFALLLAKPPPCVSIYK